MIVKYHYHTLFFVESDKNNHPKDFIFKIILYWWKLFSSEFDKFFVKGIYIYSISCHKNSVKDWICLKSLYNMLTRCKTNLLRCDSLWIKQFKKLISGWLRAWLFSNKIVYKLGYRLNLAPRFLANLVSCSDYLSFFLSIFCLGCEIIL